jgi:hypothetical protein
MTTAIEVLQAELDWAEELRAIKSAAGVIALAPLTAWIASNYPGKGIPAATIQAVLNDIEEYANNLPARLKGLITDYARSEVGAAGGILKSIESGGVPLRDLPDSFARPYTRRMVITHAADVGEALLAGVIACASA